MQSSGLNVAAATLAVLVTSALLPPTEKGSPPAAFAQATQPDAGGEVPPSGQRDTEAQAGFVYLMGEVPRPGAYTVPGDATLTLRQLLASAGGLGEDADLSAIDVLVVRNGDETPNRVGTVDAVLEPGGAGDHPVRPGDLIRFVDRRKAAESAQSRLISVAFDQTPLENAIATIDKQMDGTSVYVDWAALEVIGVMPDAPVTLTLNDIDATTVLRLTVRQANGRLVVGPVKGAEGRVLGVTTQENSALLEPTPTVDPDKKAVVLEIATVIEAYRQQAAAGNEVGPIREQDLTPAQEVAVAISGSLEAQGHRNVAVNTVLDRLVVVGDAVARESASTIVDQLISSFNIEREMAVWRPGGDLTITREWLADLRKRRAKLIELGHDLNHRHVQGLDQQINSAEWALERLSEKEGK